MRSSQIESVLAAAGAGSFSGAAVRLGVSPSSLTRSVAALEREIGARLFRRPGGPAVPTPAGEAFLAAAPAVLAAVAAARSAVEGPSRCLPQSPCASRAPLDHRYHPRY